MLPIIFILCFHLNFKCEINPPPSQELEKYMVLIMVSSGIIDKFSTRKPVIICREWEIHPEIRYREMCFSLFTLSFKSIVCWEAQHCQPDFAFQPAKMFLNSELETVVRVNDWNLYNVLSVRTVPLKKFKS